MNHVAFVCPLYDMKNHFDLAIDLVKSKDNCGIKADLIFIFSNEEQEEHFAGRLQAECPSASVLSAILPAELEPYTAKAVVKKLWGLKAYMTAYQYIILVDCETKFVRHFDADALAEEIWNTRSMLASNLSPDGFMIMRKCYKAMGLYYNKKLRKELEGFKYNFWFNDLQVYQCAMLPEFFQWLKQFDKEKILNNWNCFEYYVFFAFLCLEKDFHIKKFHYVSPGGINEYMSAFSLAKQNRILQKMNLHWTSSTEVQSEQIVMLFHLDRSKTDDQYGNMLLHFVPLLKCIIKRYLILIIEMPEMIKSKIHA